MANRGILVVVSGFSGAGKGTLMKHLLEKYDNYALSISATTRAPREGEEHGREYFFHTKQEFEELILHDALIEYAQYVDYILINDDIEECVDTMHEVIQSQHNKSSNNVAFIEKITGEVAVFAKGE